MKIKKSDINQAISIITLNVSKFNQKAEIARPDERKEKKFKKERKGKKRKWKKN